MLGDIKKIFPLYHFQSLSYSQTGCVHAPLVQTALHITLHCSDSTEHHPSKQGHVSLLPLRTRLTTSSSWEPATTALHQSWALPSVTKAVPLPAQAGINQWVCSATKSSDCSSRLPSLPSLEFRHPHSKLHGAADLKENLTFLLPRWIPSSVLTQTAE